MEDLKIGDKVIYTSDIKSVIHTYFDELFIQVSIYEVLGMDSPNDLYCYVKNTKTGQYSFRLKQFMVKVEE